MCVASRESGCGCAQEGQAELSTWEAHTHFALFNTTEKRTRSSTSRNTTRSGNKPEMLPFFQLSKTEEKRKGYYHHRHMVAYLNEICTREKDYDDYDHQMDEERKA
ncbi:hypothetical protein L596_012738 [Steinernema carpocapsae]|uniref:Uncharacterized protein n=1 Tax=Steinernema carpocapsae TaxID=34508 RepID=A0A4U5NY54_STECR|nr:hypothetical protein L596_012738 [Steinernema carpocapsae]